jgi:hypothetical protein
MYVDSGSKSRRANHEVWVPATRQPHPAGLALIHAFSLAFDAGRPKLRHFRDGRFDEEGVFTPGQCVSKTDASPRSCLHPILYILDGTIT